MPPILPGQGAVRVLLVASPQGGGVSRGGSAHQGAGSGGLPTEICSLTCTVAFKAPTALRAGWSPESRCPKVPADPADRLQHSGPTTIAARPTGRTG